MLNWPFDFIFTILMKVLVSCMENPNLFIEVLDKLGHFIDKNVDFDQNKISFSRLSPNFVLPITFFPSNLNSSPFQVEDFFT
jgi:hypothetical protein